MRKEFTQQTIVFGMLFPMKKKRHENLYIFKGYLESYQIAICVIFNWIFDFSLQLLLSPPRRHTLNSNEFLRTEWSLLNCSPWLLHWANKFHRVVLDGSIRKNEWRNSIDLILWYFFFYYAHFNIFILSCFHITVFLFCCCCCFCFREKSCRDSQYVFIFLPQINSMLITFSTIKTMYRKFDIEKLELFGIDVRTSYYEV